MHTFMSHLKGHKTNEVICKQDGTCNISSGNVWRDCADSFGKKIDFLKCDTLGHILTGTGVQ